MIQTRAEAILEKHRVDGLVRDLKVKIGKAKNDAFTHQRYMDPKAYRKLESDLEKAKQESQAIQVRLTELKAQEKAQNMAEESKNRDHFRVAAKELLDPDLYDEIVQAAAEYEE